MSSDQILDATCDEISEHGWDLASARRIAKRMGGVTYGSLYSRFGSMRDLFIEALNSQLDALLDMLEAALRRDDVGRGLEHLAVLQFSAGDPEKRSLLIEAFVAARRSPEFHLGFLKRLNRHRDLLTKVVRRDQAAGVIAPDLDVDVVVRAIRAFSIGITILDEVDPEPIDPDAAAQLLSRLFSGGLGPASDASGAAGLTGA
jgi:AcrR family transcriptional regulator